MIDAVVYTTNTGFSKEYALMLGNELNLPVYELEKALKEIKKDTEIAYLGWVMADNIVGYKKVATYFKVSVLCAVDLSSNKDRIAKANIIDNNTELFVLKGGINLNRLKGFKKFLMKIISKSMIKDLEIKQNLDLEDKKLLAILKGEESGVLKNNLSEAISYIRRQERK